MSYGRKFAVAAAVCLLCSMPVMAASPSGNGALHVEGTRLVDAKGEAVSLKGISTHGIAWFPDYVNAACFEQLHSQWNADVIRIAMYTAESGGYCTDGDQEYLKQLVCSGSVWNGSLTSLALGSNAAMETLDCSYNHVSAISLPSSLAELQCRFNSLRSVNLGNCRRLKALDCFGNMLEHLDLSGLGELESLVAGMNSFTDLDLSGNLRLKYVDLSDSPFLETVYVARGQKIEELIVGNSVDIEYKE